jgi:uncharacterized protein (TIGR04255 family)
LDSISFLRILDEIGPPGRLNGSRPDAYETYSLLIPFHLKYYPGTQFRGATEGPLATPKLKEPPIVEAICELRLTGGTSYSLVPGSMRELIKERFPETEILPAAMLPAGFDLTALSAIPHHRFKSRSPNALVQTGPGLLSINVLPSYPGFEVFRDLIMYVVQRFEKAIGFERVSRIGLRYINLLHGSEDGGDLSHFLNVKVQYPESLPHPPREVSSRVLLSTSPQGTLALAIAFPAQIGKGPFGALLDMDLFWEPPPDFRLDSFPRWLINAHDMIYKAFVATVSDRVLDRMI